MRKLICIVALTLTPQVAFAGAADGVWKTAVGENGGYLEVTVGPCGSDHAKTCGEITAAFDKNGPDRSYPNIGKLIVKDMETDGTASYSGGTIWDPKQNKTYSSKMTVKGNVMNVEGCITFFCDGQDWSRVK